MKCNCIICTGKWGKSKLSDKEKVAVLLSVLRSFHVKPKRRKK